jgi:hypothetical protein
MWIGFVWLRIRIDRELLWTRQWTSGLNKFIGMSWLTEQALASQEQLCSMESVVWKTLRVHNLYFSPNIINLTSWSWALLEKLPVVQLLQNFPAFYGTRRFITVFTRGLHWSLSWARSIQTTPPHVSKIHFNIIHPPPEILLGWSN